MHAINQNGETVADGSADVRAPRRKIRRLAVQLPALVIENAGWVSDVAPIAQSPAAAEEIGETLAEQRSA